VSLQTEAEQLRQLADQIVRAEISRDKITASGGTFFIDDNPDLPSSYTASQKQGALALEAGWKAAAKAITAGW